MRKFVSRLAVAVVAAGLLVGGGAAQACPSDSKIGLAVGSAVVGYIGWNTTMGVSEVGAPIAILAFGLYNNYCTTGSMFTAPPSKFVTVVAPPYNQTHVKQAALDVGYHMEVAAAQ